LSADRRAQQLRLEMTAGIGSQIAGGFFCKKYNKKESIQLTP